jgi:PEP-CTERM/exosortase A-associated glycosyltransferase
MRILHILHRSVPGTHGYAIRSREIVQSQLAIGMEPLVITSPSQAPLGDLDAEQSEVIDGIRYFRTCGSLLAPTKEVYDKSPVRSALRVLQNLSLLFRARRIAREYSPKVIHAHSPFTCGLIGNAVGRLEAIPTVYEVRGIWEDSHVGRYGLGETSARYRLVRALENRAARGADCCCVICDALEGEMRSRGVEKNRILVAPNGVDLDAFAPGPADPALLRELGLEGAIVIGYIGSFFHYEGLDLLVRIVEPLGRDFPELRLLLVGDGESMSALRKLAAESRVADRVIFTGRVAHARIADYYRLFDLLVLPRRDTRETRLVTPLKPMEIMAMAKPVVASDIGGHREIVVDGMNGVLFSSESTVDLAAKCRTLLRDARTRQDLGLRGREWVEGHRHWKVLVQRYVELYEKLTS